MLNPITSIIVDDEKDARDGLESIISQFLPNIKIIGKSENAQNALEIIIDQYPDIVFLDIQMPVNNGFWLANKLNKLKKDICIIFVTAYDKYAIKAIKYAAFDFLTKPIDIKKLNKSVNRYLTNKDNYNLQHKLKNLETFFQQEQIKLNTQYGFIMVTTDEIIYCNTDRDKYNVYLTNGKTEVVYFDLDTLKQKLNERSFIKINKSTIINLNYLESYDISSKRIILSDVLQKYEFKANSSGSKLLSTQLNK